MGCFDEVVEIVLSRMKVSGKTVNLKTARQAIKTITALDMFQDKC